MEPCLICAGVRPAYRLIFPLRSRHPAPQPPAARQRQTSPETHAEPSSQLTGVLSSVVPAELSHSEQPAAAYQQSHAPPRPGSRCTLVPHRAESIVNT